MAALDYLYDETTRRLRKSYAPTRIHSLSSGHGRPRRSRAAKFSEKDFWDSSVVEEIRRSGFIDQLYKNRDQR